jgi:hypothetical protein
MFLFSLTVSCFASHHDALKKDELETLKKAKGNARKLTAKVAAATNAAEGASIAKTLEAELANAVALQTAAEGVVQEKLMGGLSIIHMPAWVGQVQCSLLDSNVTLEDDVGLHACVV